MRYTAPVNRCNRSGTHKYLGDSWDWYRRGARSRGNCGPSDGDRADHPSRYPAHPTVFG